MIAKNLCRLKVEKSPLSVTSYAGIPLLTELAHQIGLVKRLDSIPGLWQRHKTYGTSDYVLGLAMTLVAGGERLDDMRLLRCDEGLNRLSFPELPASNSVGEFLRRFGRRSLYHLAETTAQEALRHVRAGQTVTLDVDSTVIESHKEQAKMTYNGVRGYNPLLAWLAEPNIFLAGVFREGNAAPQEHNLSLLKYCHRRLPDGTKLRFRSDSAGYQLKVIEYCHRHGIGFTIGTDLDPAVVEAIENIPKKDWRLVVKDEETFLLGETIHVPGGGNNAFDLPAFRLIVTRKLSGQLELFEPHEKRRAILSNFDETWTTGKILEHHNERGAMEKAIGEIKNGYGLAHIPCGELMANAAYFQIGMLAHNLVQTFKTFALPEGWKKFSIKNLRFRLICQAAVVVRHARRLIVKLSAAFPFFDVFERARWLVMSPQWATASG